MGLPHSDVLSNTSTIPHCQRQGISLTGSLATFMQKVCMFLFLCGKRKNNSLLERDAKMGGGQTADTNFKLKDTVCVSS